MERPRSLEQAPELKKGGQRLVLDCRSPRDQKELVRALQSVLGEEGAEQLSFLLNKLSRENFTNQCNKATQALGKSLAENYGGEESFFELIPAANFYDLKSDAPLEKTSYRGDFHSVGVITVPQKEKAPVSIVVDLTYFVVNNEGQKKDPALVMTVSGDLPQACDRLAQEYGGVWKKDYTFNKEKGTFVFNDK
jgi:hypothetical protein